MKDPTVSIVVPTFNRVGYIGECLDSLLAQQHAAAEIIVVDDGSEDGTQEYLRRYGTRIRYLRKNNGGKPSAVNLALRAATSDYIWIFDDDDVALPDAIGNRLQALADIPQAGFVYSAHFTGRDGPAGRIVTDSLLMPQRPPAEAFFLAIMRECFFHLNSTLVRRDLYSTLGGLDPELLSGEDYDFQIRLARVASPAFCASPTFIFRQHAGSRGAAQIRYAAKDRSVVFRRYSQSVGRKIRRQVELGEFLIPPLQGPLDDTQRHCALLNRLHVMANHGCTEEYVEDMRLLLNDGRCRLTAQDLQEVGRSFTRGWAFEASSANWPSFERSLLALRQVPGGRECIRAVGRGILSLATGHSGDLSSRTRKVARALALTLQSAI